MDGIAASDNLLNSWDWAEPAEDGGETLSGIVRSVLFSNAENGYAVLSLTDTDGAEQTLVGTFPYAWPGEAITAYGRWTVHSIYGRQFEAESAERSAPADEQAVFRYLAAGTVRGIGPATASQIVSRFGDRALLVLEKQPELLAELPGISLKKAEQFAREYRRQEDLKQLVMLLVSCGIAPEYAVRLYRCYGEQAAELLRGNPSLLTSEGVRAPFAAADRLANELGISETDPNRIRAGIRFVLEHNERNGHCFIPYAKLRAAAAQQLNLAEDEVAAVLDAMSEAQELVRESAAGQDACYLPELYRAERGTAERLAALAAEEDAGAPCPDPDALTAELEAEQGLKLAPLQKQILQLAARKHLLAVTGGPGTGKTTSLRAVVKLYERLHLKTLLAAPTGRAARRMADLTGAEAATIHRLLGAKRAEESGKPVFTQNRGNRLNCDALIVDECSMIDIRLMYALLEALPEHARLVLVGDASQLPSVGPGDVFSAIVRSGTVPTVKLTEIFRQQDGSRIVRNAHMINSGEHPDLAENAGDFFRLKRLQAGSMAETVVELCSRRLPEKLHLPPEEIQVLSPTRKGDCGTLALNRALQAALNPPADGKRERSFRGMVFREGDRLIQNRNNYDILWQRPDGSEGAGIFNGEVGILKTVDPEGQTLTVDFDGRLALYEPEMLEDLEHAWALTVHKAQGCEYRAVVLALTEASPRLLTRMVLYTAVTRARELLILVGSDSTVFRMIDNIAPTRRSNALRVRLKEAAGR